MRIKFFIIFSIALLSSLVASAQRFIDFGTTTKPDTLTNAVTRTYATTPTFIDALYSYSVHVKADSLSGANAGTVTLEVCNDRTGTNWIAIQTMTVDGTGTDEAIWEGALRARRVRVRWVMPAGTRTVRAQTYGVLKREVGY